jgi:hypothetical protein
VSGVDVWAATADERLEALVAGIGDVADRGESHRTARAER